ncbi:putative maleylacetoacetate isomerase [Burkholderiales bacterium]|nr:putative maleylacetoacetate isomerase [Burkholderiales bacterium]
MPTLYSYARSSAAWRVRIALAWKAVAVHTVPVHLLHGGGEQHSPPYRAINPQGLVPCLLDDGVAIAQSVAICEYLEERYPQPALLPRGHLERAQVRSLVHAIACDIHPLNNLRVLQYLKATLGRSPQEVDDWYRHWIHVGFASLEAEFTRSGSQQYCVGGAVSMADVFLVPQVFNARRLKIDLTDYPRIVAIDAALSKLPAFADTAPSKQPDFVE